MCSALPADPAIIFFNLKALIALIDWGLDPAQAAALVNFGSTEDRFCSKPGRNGTRSPTAWPPWVTR